MKKIKYILFFIPFLFSLNVFAADYNVSSNVKYNVSLPGGSYGADDLNDGYNTIMGRYNVGTRYNGRIGYMEFYVSCESFNCSTNHTYTITLNMATNDWRNNFMGPIVYKCNSDGSEQSTNSHLTVSNFRFISRKQIKFNFRTNSSLSPYYKFILYSNNYVSQGGTAITGDTNWNLSSIIISDNSSSSGGSSGTTPTPPPTPSASNIDIIDNANQNTDDIINNNNQNTTDIIDNANHNSQDIIDNQNKNQEQTNQLLGQCFTNIYNISHVDNIYNFLNNNGVFIQKDPDSNNYSKNLKLQFFNDNTIVSQSSYTPVLVVGRFKFDFTKNSSFNNIRFGVNGTEIDTLIAYDVSYLKDNHDYSLIFDITNAENGSVTLEKIMITDRVSYLLPYISYNETSCNSKLDTIGQSVLDGAQSIIGNNNTNTQNIIEGVQNGANSISDKVNEQIDSQRVCKQVDVSSSSVLNHVLSSTGSLIVSNYYNVTDYINIKNSTVKKLDSYNGSAYFCYYDLNKSLISCVVNSSVPINSYLVIPSNAEYVRFTIDKNANKPRYEICTNGNQVINDNLNDIKDSLTDETVPDIDLDLDLDTNSPVSDLLTMPLTILNKLFDITDDTCEPYSILFDFTGGNNTLTFPCIDLKNYLGNTVYNILDTILCFFLCYEIGMMCISIYEDITSLRDGFDSLYTPRHHNTSTRVGRGEMEGKY